MVSGNSLPPCLLIYHLNQTHSPKIKQQQISISDHLQHMSRLDYSRTGIGDTQRMSEWVLMVRQQGLGGTRHKDKDYLLDNTLSVPTDLPTGGGGGNELSQAQGGDESRNGYVQYWEGFQAFRVFCVCVWPRLSAVLTMALTVSDSSS